mgnify:CR=1 FL=1
MAGSWSLRSRSKSCSVGNLRVYSPRLRKQKWEQFHVKTTGKGPMVWEAKESSFYFKVENGISFQHRVVFCRNPTDGEIKYFITNVTDAPLEKILHVLDRVSR